MERTKSPNVQQMFSRIAGTYDLLNRVLSAGRDAAWRRQVAASVNADAKRVLDLCAGTGDLALELKRQHPEAHVVAGDFCFEMLQRGAHKGLQEKTCTATLDAQRLPFADHTFDAITVAFGVRNFEFLEQGLKEIRRVLRPGGQLAVLEFFRADRSWRNKPFEMYFKHVLPRVGQAVSGDREAYAYLPQSVGRFVTRREFTALLQKHDFADIEQKEMTLRIATLFLARASRLAEVSLKR